MDENRRQFLAYKGNRCKQCGLTVDSVLRRYRTLAHQFHFHHRDPSTKHTKYDNVIRRVVSTEVLDELDKCVLLCSRCHGIAEGQNIRGQFTLEADFFGRRVKQASDACAIVEYDLETEEPTYSFYLDRPIGLEPYRILIPGREPMIHTLAEMGEGDFFLNLIEGTKQTRRFEIRCYRNSGFLPDEDNAPVLFVERINKKRFHLEMRIAFPLFKVELKPEEGKKPEIWLRWGQALLRSGEIYDDGRIFLDADYPENRSGEVNAIEAVPT